MNADRYKLKVDEEQILFEFTSVGKKGEIKKVVQYTEFINKGHFNLGFGDWDETTGIINDTVVSNNGDTEKVLATVVSTLNVFFLWHPKALVFASGSTPARTRLYRIGITNNLVELRFNFEVFGMLEGQFQSFERNCDYEAFLIRKKAINL